MAHMQEDNSQPHISWRDKISDVRLATLASAIFSGVWEESVEDETAIVRRPDEAMGIPGTPQPEISIASIFDQARGVDPQQVFELHIPDEPDAVSEILAGSLWQPAELAQPVSEMLDYPILQVRGRRQIRDQVTDALNQYQLKDEPQLPRQKIRVPYVFEAGRVTVASVTVAPSWSMTELRKQPEKSRALRTAGWFGGGAVASILAVIGHAAWAGMFVVASDPMLIQIDHHEFDDEPGLQERIEVINRNALLGAKLAAGALLEKSTADWLRHVLRFKQHRIDPPEQLIARLKLAVLFADASMQLIDTLPITNNEWDLAAASTSAYLTGVSNRGQIQVLDEEAEHYMLERLAAYG